MSDNTISTGGPNVIPHLTTAQIAAINSPSNGLLVYNTQTLLFRYYDGTAWQTIESTEAGGIPTLAQVLGSGRAADATGTMNDFAGIKSIDIRHRSMWYTNGTTKVSDWSVLQDFDTSGILSIDWGNRLLADSGAASSVDYQNRLLIDNAAATSLDFQNRIITGAWSLSSTLNKLTLTTPATAATLTIVNNKTFTVNKTLTLDGTDSTTMTFPSTSATIARTDAANTFSGHQTIEGVTSTGATGTGNLVFSVSPGLTGTPTAPTAVSTDNSTTLSTTAFVTTAISNAIAGVNPAIAAQYATTAAADTSGLTYANGVSGIGATMTGVNNTVTTIDGHAFVIGDIGKRLLIKNDTQVPSGAFNGVYTFTALHTVGTGDIFTRALDFDQSTDINNTGAIPVVNGTANATTSWVVTSTVTTVGTDPITFTQFSLSPSATGTGLDVRQTSPTLITPLLGTPTSGALTNCTSIPVANATGKLPLANGGTNADLSGTGGASQVLKQTTVGGAVTVAQLASTDISDITTGTFVPATTGFSAAPTLIGIYTKVGKMVTIQLINNGVGTSNATTFTITNLPYTASNTNDAGNVQYGLILVGDNGAFTTTPGNYAITANTTICVFGINANGAAGGFTNAGGKVAKGVITYFTD